MGIGRALLSKCWQSCLTAACSLYTSQALSGGSYFCRAASSGRERVMVGFRRFFFTRIIALPFFAAHNWVRFAVSIVRVMTMWQAVAVRPPNSTLISESPEALLQCFRACFVFGIVVHLNFRGMGNRTPSSPTPRVCAAVTLYPEYPKI
ncbi:MAG: hypothetical protein UX98_C0001G0009 [Parcubacteria group bacterium GW2011_GWA2_47_26]|nr:MAG: hypothetical protein UX98_C0001G0009 [Parcubacteria group bacterium GW2011_GWA2_47_26]